MDDNKFIEQYLINLQMKKNRCMVEREVYIASFDAKMDILDGVITVLENHIDKGGK